MMNTYAEKNRNPERKQHRESNKATFPFVDNRPETIAQLKMQELAEKRSMENSPLQLQSNSLEGNPIQRAANNTGLPDTLKSGIEHLSGYSMNDVKVHYNSSKPAQLNAHAYAQGTDIHLASGQEKHLGHEAWHVVQQKQGRVQATKQLKGKIGINDDVQLEREADAMGAKAMSQTTKLPANKTNLYSKSGVGPIQRQITLDKVEDNQAINHADFDITQEAISSAEKAIFQKWKTSGAHQYADKVSLFAALKLAAVPSTDNFKTIFEKVANDEKETTDWIEQMLTDTDGTLGFIQSHNASELLEAIKKFNQGFNLSEDNLKEQNIGQLLVTLLNTNMISQSCGQTSNMVHDFLSPSTRNNAVESKNLDEYMESIREANRLSVENMEHYYVRMDSTGHSFIIEVFNDQCFIYQSFFGSYTLARDLKRGEVYPIETLISKLKIAFTADNAPQQGLLDTARRGLFNSAAVHPYASYDVRIFKQDAGVEMRTTEKLKAQKQLWAQHLPKKAKDILMNDIDKDEKAPPMSVMDYEFWMIGSMFTFAEGDDVVNKGELAIGAIGAFEDPVYKTLNYKLVSKTNKNYRLELVKKT